MHQRDSLLTLAESNELANLFRDAVLSEKYYSRCLKKNKQSARRIAICIAIVGSTALISNRLMGTTAGELCLLAIGLITALLVAIKPFFDDLAQQERFRMLKVHYGTVSERIERVFVELKAGVSCAHRIEEVRHYANALTAFDDAEPDRMIINELQAEVNREFPPSFFEWEIRQAA